MRTSFPTREELCKLPLHSLRNIDIKEKDEEELVQEVLNKRLASQQIVGEPIRLKVPDIKTKEEEEYWQKKVDEANAKNKAGALNQSPVPEVPAELVPPVAGVPVEPTPVPVEKPEPKRRGRKPKSE